METFKVIVTNLEDGTTSMQDIPLPEKSEHGTKSIWVQEDRTWTLDIAGPIKAKIFKTTCNCEFCVDNEIDHNLILVGVMYTFPAEATDDPVILQYAKTDIQDLNSFQQWLAQEFLDCFEKKKHLSYHDIVLN